MHLSLYLCSISITLPQTRVCDEGHKISFCRGLMKKTNQSNLAPNYSTNADQSEDHNSRVTKVYVLMAVCTAGGVVACAVRVITKLLDCSLVTKKNESKRMSERIEPFGSPLAIWFIVCLAKTIFLFVPRSRRTEPRQGVIRVNTARIIDLLLLFLRFRSPKSSFVRSETSVLT